MSAAVQPLLRCWTCSAQTNHRKMVSLLVKIVFTSKMLSSRSNERWWYWRNQDYQIILGENCINKLHDSFNLMLMTRLLVHILFGLDNNNRNHCAKSRVDCTNNHLAWICVIEDLTLLLPTLVAWLSAYTRGSNYWILEFLGNFFYE